MIGYNYHRRQNHLGRISNQPISFSFYGSQHLVWWIACWHRFLMQFVKIKPTLAELETREEEEYVVFLKWDFECFLSFMLLVLPYYFPFFRLTSTLANTRARSFTTTPVEWSVHAWRWLYVYQMALLLLQTLFPMLFLKWRNDPCSSWNENLWKKNIQAEKEKRWKERVSFLRAFSLSLVFFLSLCTAAADGSWYAVWLKDFKTMRTHASQKK